MTIFVSFQPRFGICFDVDGVLARGTLAIPAAQKAFKYLLQDEKGDIQAPIVFVTNSLNRNQDKANQIASWFNVPVSVLCKQNVCSLKNLNKISKFH